MISKKNRFTKKLFDFSFRRARHFRKGMFEILITKNTKNERWSVVVGKKASKLAVKRNRIRRQLYECIRQKFLGKCSSQNIICLYKGGEKLDNTIEFEQTINTILSEGLNKNASQKIFKN